jgi:hypothetical protein
MKPKDDFIFEKPLPIIFSSRNRPTLTPTASCTVISEREPISYSAYPFTMTRPFEDPFIRPINIKNLPLDSKKDSLYLNLADNTSSILLGKEKLTDPKKTFPNIIDLVSDENDRENKTPGNFTPIDIKEDNTRYERKKVRKKSHHNGNKISKYSKREKRFNDDGRKFVFFEKEEKKIKRKTMDGYPKEKNFYDHHQRTYEKNFFQ